MNAIWFLAQVCLLSTTPSFGVECCLVLVLPRRQAKERVWSAHRETYGGGDGDGDGDFFDPMISTSSTDLNASSDTAFRLDYSLAWQLTYFTSFLDNVQNLEDGIHREVVVVLLSAGVDVDADGDEEDGEESEVEDGVDEDGEAARLHVAELHHPPPGRQLEQQHRHLHRPPIRHGPFMLTLPTAPVYASYRDRERGGCDVQFKQESGPPHVFSDGESGRGCVSVKWVAKERRREDAALRLLTLWMIPPGTTRVTNLHGVGGFPVAHTNLHGTRHSQASMGPTRVMHHLNQV
ncbi:hypothetical protein B296_00043106 [Ensete ventricosum]|uniref:Secreted protein n=1 Tax=Ensete ventricosum TaxID=4639 RepID=A0A426XUF1_ENSVE|nr:hypothetical protein B296_00043106 [Ensete ventricosum]